MLPHWRDWEVRLRRRPHVYLHIGAMKTGTTYLQGLLVANKDRLADAGYLFPGERWTDQSRAAADVLGFSLDDPRRRASVEGRWDRIVSEMLAHRGRGAKASIFSMEFLSFADTEQATRILDSLSEAHVEVVLTVRDTVSTIPAQWQTSCRNGGKVPYRRFVYGVRDALAQHGQQGRASKPVRLFRRTQDIERMLDVWVPLLGPRRVHVVTVPPRGADPALLWHRFASVVGVDPDVCEQPDDVSNSSLGHASTELMRLINKRLDLSPTDYTLLVKGPLARRILGSRASQEQPIRMNRRGHVFGVRWNRLMRAAIERHGVRVVGSLDDLDVTRPGTDLRRKLPRATPEEIVAAAVHARDGLVALRDQLRTELPDRSASEKALDVKVLRLPRLPVAPVTEPDHWAGRPDPLDAAVQELVALVEECVAVSHEKLLPGGGTIPPEIGGPDAPDDTETTDETDITAPTV